MSDTIELKVTGMTCDHCVNAVTEALQSVEGVSEAIVSLERHAATVKGEGVVSSALLEAIEEEGYEAAVVG